MKVFVAGATGAIGRQLDLAICSSNVITGEQHHRVLGVLGVRLELLDQRPSAVGLLVQNDYLVIASLLQESGYFLAPSCVMAMNEEDHRSRG
jgi:hypothetical protein